MKLIITKSQIDAPMGVRFALTCRLEVAPEEAALIRHYAPSYRFGKAGDVWDFIDHAITFEDPDVRAVQDRADKLKKACQRLRRRLEQATRYTGQEEFEF